MARGHLSSQLISHRTDPVATTTPLTPDERQSLALLVAFSPSSRPALKRALEGNKGWTPKVFTCFDLIYLLMEEVGKTTCTARKVSVSLEEPSRLAG